MYLEEFYPIPTWTERETLSYCGWVASQSQALVEIGTYMGASARAMLINSQAHLWCVDKFEVFGTREITEMFLRKWIQENRCEIIQGDSNKAAEILVHMRGKIDAVWIDDGHAEEDLRRDIRNALPLLKPGGILFGHDWQNDNDVARGVLSMIPREQLTFPVARVWQFKKPL